MPSFYLPELKINSTNITISGDEYHHIVNVYRHRIGDELWLNSGSGILAKALISQIGKRELRCEVIEPVEYKRPEPRLALAFSLLKGKHDEFIIEKATELGTAEFFPITTEYSVRKAAPNTISRYQKTALAAIKQCDNPYLPEVHPVHSLRDVIYLCKSMGYKVMAASERRPERTFLQHQPLVCTCFLIGPEGGWSKAELEQFDQSEVVEISLSPLILRAETAAISIAAQWNLLQSII